MADQDFAKGGRTMASVERKPITGVRGRSPQWGPPAEPLVELSSPEADSFLSIFKAKVKDLNEMI